MDVDARKLRILQAIIEDYILSNAPVGSRTLSKTSGLGVSSATIRNEMADLTIFSRNMSISLTSLLLLTFLIGSCLTVMQAQELETIIAHGCMD